MCYADDIILLAPSCKGLQIIVDKFECYFNEIKFIMNVSKSAYIVFKYNIRLKRSSKKFSMVKRCLGLKTVGVQVLFSTKMVRLVLMLKDAAICF